MLRAGRYVARLSAPEPVDHCLRSTLADLVMLPVPEGAEPHAVNLDGGHIDITAASRGTYAIRSDGRLWDNSVSEPDVADEVVHMLMRAALDEESERVHIHAGAVSAPDGRSVVVGGWSGSGKSTAISALVVGGYRYITDERLTVSSDGRSISGFPKPISLIAGSFETLAHLDPRRTGHGAGNETTWQVPASSIGPIARQEAHHPSLLVFVAHEPGAGTRIASVAPATAAARLIGDSPDVIARGHGGAEAIVALSCSVPSVEMSYSDLDDVVATFGSLLHTALEPVDHESMLVRGCAMAGTRPPRYPEAVDVDLSYSIADGVSVWVIDDLAVAYVAANGTVVEIDGISTVWVQLLADADRLEDLIDDVADVTGTAVAVIAETAQHVVHGLWGAGVVGPIRNG